MTEPKGAPSETRRVATLRGDATTCVAATKTSRSVLSHDPRFTGTDCHGTVRSEQWTSSAAYITNIGWNNAWLEPSKVSAEDTWVEWKMSPSPGRDGRVLIQTLKPELFLRLVRHD